MGKITVYVSEISGNLKMKKNQQKIYDILNAKKIEYEVVDISSVDQAKETMRTGMGDPKGLPPQVFNGEEYCGDYDKFEEANEDGALLPFLKLPSEQK